ncbi:MAG: SGNH/GDSL hydrolase family protein [Clostridia bacterium]|nr:SGNH/GDSL hydrolase family protein [Clostridia bacterium]
MKLITLGDSITRGSFFEHDEWGVADPNYSQVLKELLGADELVCSGVNGTAISILSPTNTEYVFTVRAKELKDADVFVIAGGTNDFGNNDGVPLGTPEDTEDISFYGALDFLYRIVKENNPKAEIYAVTPIPRQWESENPSGHTLNDYRRAIEVKAREYGFSVIDGSKVGIDATTAEGRAKHLPDGLHPNVAGHKLYGNYLYQEIIKTR